MNNQNKKVDSLASLSMLSKRHYKKDSRFVFDLYTICYDENESVDTVELFTSIINNAAGIWSQKRKNDREEIRRRLAIGAEETRCEKYEGWETYSQFRMKNGIRVRRLSEAVSDTESHSSDSETCPKLSRCSQNNSEVFNISSAEKPHNMRSLSSNSLYKKQEGKEHTERKQTPFAITNDKDESDFFTKQAKLQVEARMALIQAKEMAHMQMQFERQNQRISPITAIIRSSMENVGVHLATDKRRVSRQMLTEMNLAQLQILVNNLHTHIEELNETLVHFLMERDDLHMGQDSMLIDIEELTRFLGTKEQNVQDSRLSANITNQSSSIGFLNY